MRKVGMGAVEPDVGVGKEQAIAEGEGRKVQKKMFLPLVNLWREYPEMRDALVGR